MFRLSSKPWEGPVVAARGPSSPSSEQYAPQQRHVDSPQALKNLRCFAQLQEWSLSRMLPQAIADFVKHNFGELDDTTIFEKIR